MSSRAVLIGSLCLRDSRGVVMAPWDQAQDLLTCESTHQLPSEAAHKWGATHILFTFASY